MIFEQLQHDGCQSYLIGCPETCAGIVVDPESSRVPFMAMEEVRRLESGDTELVLLDVRERDAFQAGHIPGAIHVPRGQLDLRIDNVLPDPTRRIVVCCEFGKISTLAAATLQSMGFGRAVALDGGIKPWRDAGYPLEPPRPAA